MQKRERQDALIRLVGTERVPSQFELVKRLQDRGFSVTQASISRDLDELGIVKSNGNYTVPRDPVELGSATFTRVGDNLIVGRCMSGLASAITVRIDAKRMDGIVGTIAGDDTIFIAVGGRDELDRVLEELRILI